jgi:hypothetical protein
MKPRQISDVPLEHAETYCRELITETHLFLCVTYAQRVRRHTMSWKRERGAHIVRSSHRKRNSNPVPHQEDSGAKYQP